MLIFDILKYLVSLKPLPHKVFQFYIDILLSLYLIIPIPLLFSNPYIGILKIFYFLLDQFISIFPQYSIVKGLLFYQLSASKTLPSFYNFIAKDPTVDSER